ncbi:hypothetical protein A3711_02870 [Erythrobacter sp. HI00D59]|nr:hypothetical protein A3711_02870 [Erythrobacter sp. HI00D59]
MKLLHVCDSIIGGTGSYLAELLPLQAAQYGPNNISLLMPQQHTSYLERRVRESEIDILTFERNSRLHGMASLARVYASLDRRKYDIIHAHSFGAGVISRLIPKSAPIVFCPHGWSFDMEIAGMVRRLVELGERMLASRADRIVLISPHEERLALRAGIDKGKLRTIVNGIAPAGSDMAPASWDDERLKLLFVGRFDPQKGLDILLEAIAPLDDIATLRIVGAHAISSGLTATDLPDHVSILGWLSREKVAAQMAAADLLVVPSRWEGFGLVAIEAMRLGTAVMASNVGGLADILDGGKYGFPVPPGNVAAWQAAIRGLDPAEISRRAIAGQKRFHEFYSAERMAEETALIYRELIPSRSGEP